MGEKGNEMNSNSYEKFSPFILMASMATPESLWWGSSVSDLLVPPQGPSSIVTFSQTVDTLLGGGVPLGLITELHGVPGVGKTQMALQLCLDVQIPAQLGGCGAGAVFIDTEGGLMPGRLAAMARKVEEHMGRIIAKGPPASYPPAVAAQVSAAAQLSNVAYARITTLAALCEAITEGLPALLRQRAAQGGGLLPIKLVVIDSLAFHFRAASELDPGERTRRLAGLGVALTRLAQAHGCAVVVTNHMVSQRGDWEGGAAAAAAAAAGAATAATAVAAAASASGGALDPQEALAAALDPETSRLCPALGDAWAHYPATRLHLKWDRGCRCVVLAKSLQAGGLPAGVHTGAASGAAGGQQAEAAAMQGSGCTLLPPAPFVVQKEGIRGLPIRKPKKAKGGGQ